MQGCREDSLFREDPLFREDLEDSLFREDPSIREVAGGGEQVTSCEAEAAQGGVMVVAEVHARAFKIMHTGTGMHACMLHERAAAGPAAARACAAGHGLPSIIGAQHGVCVCVSVCSTHGPRGAAGAQTAEQACKGGWAEGGLRRQAWPGCASQQAAHRHAAGRLAPQQQPA